MWEKEDKQNLKEMLVKLNELEDESEREHYKKLLTDWHNDNKREERRHRRHRDFQTFNKVEALVEQEAFKPATLTRLRWNESFEDIIFTKSPDDLHELVTDGVLSRIIRSLTSSQKEVLFHMRVWKYTTAETAELLGVSERNVRKLYERALYHISGQMYPIIKFRHKLETDEKYQELAREKDIYTTHSERKFIGTADEKTKAYYSEMIGAQEKPPDT